MHLHPEKYNYGELDHNYLVLLRWRSRHRNKWELRLDSDYNRFIDIILKCCDVPFLLSLQLLPPLWIPAQLETMIKCVSNFPQCMHLSPLDKPFDFKDELYFSSTSVGNLPNFEPLVAIRASLVIFSTLMPPQSDNESPPFEHEHKLARLWEKSFRWRMSLRMLSSMRCVSLYNKTRV